MKLKQMLASSLLVLVFAIGAGSSADAALVTFDFQSIGAIAGTPAIVASTDTTGTFTLSPVAGGDLSSISRNGTGLPDGTNNFGFYFGAVDGSQDFTVLDAGNNPVNFTFVSALVANNAGQDSATIGGTLNGAGGFTANVTGTSTSGDDDFVDSGVPANAALLDTLNYSAFGTPGIFPSIDNIVLDIVPEPSSMALFGLASLIALGRASRR